MCTKLSVVLVKRTEALELAINIEEKQLTKVVVAPKPRLSCNNNRKWRNPRNRVINACPAPIETFYQCQMNKLGSTTAAYKINGFSNCRLSGTGIPRLRSWNREQTSSVQDGPCTVECTSFSFSKEQHIFSEVHRTWMFSGLFHRVRELPRISWTY